VLGRCIPVPTITTHCSSRTPAAASSSRIAVTISSFGTGRVMSEMVIATVFGFFARVISTSGRASIGRRSASRTTPAASAKAGMCGTPLSTAAVSGTSSGTRPRSYSSSTVLPAMNQPTPPGATAEVANILLRMTIGTGSPPGFAQRLTLSLSRAALALAIALVLPLIVHLIPWSGAVPLGAVLLPLFLAPVLVLSFGWGRWAALATSAAPLLNHLVTGQPAGSLLWRLILELILFTYLLCSLWRWSSLRAVLIPLACLTAVASAHILILLQAGVASGLFEVLTAAVSAAAEAIARSWPGLIVLALAGLVTTLLSPRAAPPNSPDRQAP
jgi:hypothetical protein